ncbi:MAG: hypothetical protein FGM14_09815 [Flavobacteriales bacterium]|nr:hypothetical protein [Flavobacteriales bacterium]
MKKALTISFVLICLSFLASVSKNKTEIATKHEKKYSENKTDFWDKYSSGIIAGFTIFVSLGISVYQAKASHKHNRELVISEARIEWIQKLRPLLGGLISIAGTLDYKIDEFTKKKNYKNQPISELPLDMQNEVSEILLLINDFRKNFNEIKLFLNHNEVNHKKFISDVDNYIIQITNTNTTNNTKIDEDVLINSARVILKEAWEQSKESSKKMLF